MTVIRRFVFLVNPGSGVGRAERRLRALLARRPTLAARSRTVAARAPAEFLETVRDLAEDEVPVAAGGDGTVNLLARALRDAGFGNRPMGVLPLGTGNALAHALGIGTVSAAMVAVHERLPRALDALITTHPSAPLALVAVSAGFEARFLQAMHPHTAWRRWVRLPRGALRAAARPARGTAIAVDGQPLVSMHERVYNAGLYNLPCYGFGRVVWPQADGADGEAEAVVCLSRTAYWRTLLRGLGTAQPTDAATLRARRWRRARVEVRGPVQVDGEVVGPADFEVAVEPAALQVLA